MDHQLRGITTVFPLRVCGGKLLVAVTRERRYGPPTTRYGPITIAIRARFDYDSATTRYEVFRALAYEIVYENQW